MKILYFARVRQIVGIAEEDIAPPPEADNVQALIEWLKSRGPGYQAAFDDLRIIRAAIDQTHADIETPIAGASEIAFFPPVTGG